MRIVFQFVLPLLILAGSVGVSAALILQREVPQRAIEPPKPPLVETLPVRPHAGTFDVRVDGLVVPHREVSIASEVAGRVISKSDNCRAGRSVKQGTLLLEIDPRDYELEVQRLTEQLAQAEVDLDEVEIEIANSKELIGLSTEQWDLEKRKLERLRDLFSRKVISDTEIDQGRQAELNARDALQRLTNQVRLLETRKSRLASACALAETQIAKARLDLERTRVQAPLDGVIVSDVVERDMFVQRGNALVTIEDTSAVEVKCNLRAEELDWIRQQEIGPSAGDASTNSGDYELPRTPVTIEYQLAGRVYAWNGVLDRYDGIGLDEQTRTVPCRIVVNDPRSARSVQRDDETPPALVRGMYVTVRVHTNPGDAILVDVPDRAVQPGNFVWSVRESKLRAHKIVVAEAQRDTVVVSGPASGLAPGDKVVVTPLTGAMDGMPVSEAAQP